MFLSIMGTNSSSIRWLCLSAAIGSMAHGLQLPHRWLNEHATPQQILEDNHTPVDHRLRTLEDPKTLNDLFWSLTTSDALQAFDRFAASPEVDIHPHPIVLGYHTDSPPTKYDDSEHKGSHHPASLELSMSTIGGFPVFHTPIAIGNPAQPFQAWLNTSLNGLYVRSSVCDKRDCGTGFKYHPKKSTTRRSLDQRFEVNAGGWVVGGNVSTDTLHLVSVDVEDAMVGEIDKYEGENMFYYVMSFVADGALGLAPPNANASAYSPLKAPNPLHQLTESQSIAHNTLTLTLPTSTTDRGSLSIGLSPKSHKTTLRIPFANQISPGLAGTWHVPLDSISLQGNSNLHLPLKAVYARLDLDPTIRLPAETTKAIYEALGAKPNSIFRGASIGCEAREKLPDLVLEIGGNEVRLGRDEYSSQQAIYGYPFCVVGILPSEEEHVAVLGTNLLSKFHVVIDADANELGLAPRR